MHLILFGIHLYDLVVAEIHYRMFWRVMMSHLHKDINTAVDDQRGKDTFIYSSLHYKHLP